MRNHLFHRGFAGLDVAVAEKCFGRGDDHFAFPEWQKFNLVALAACNQAAALRSKLLVQIGTEQGLLCDAWNIDVRAVNAEGSNERTGIVSLIILDDRSAQAMSGEKDVLESASSSKSNGSTNFLHRSLEFRGSKALSGVGTVVGERRITGLR